jgi:prolyl 4-hydroxylase
MVQLDLTSFACFDTFLPQTFAYPRIFDDVLKVISISNFFTDEECQDCINLVTAQNSGDEKGAAMQVNSATFSPLAQSKRTSTTWYMPYEHMPTLVTKLKHILCLKEGVKQFEEPQIVRYRKGEEFSWHYDEVPAAQLQNGGQRLATALVYLNTLPKIAGGGTIFRDLSSSAGGQGDQLTMRPQRGSLLLFFPAYKDGTPDDRTLHKGEVVASSAKEPKMITQMWIHERPYSPVVPKGNNHEAALPKVAELEQQLGF